MRRTSMPAPPRRRKGEGEQTMPTYQCKDRPEIIVDVMAGGEVGATFGDGDEFTVEFPIEELLSEWVDEDHFWCAAYK